VSVKIKSPINAVGLFPLKIQYRWDFEGGDMEGGVTDSSFATNMPQAEFVLIILKTELYKNP